MKALLRKLDSLIELKLQERTLLSQVRAVTGFSNDSARKLIKLLIAWHYYDQSAHTARELSYYGIKVTPNKTTPQER